MAENMRRCGQFQVEQKGFELHTQFTLLMEMLLSALNKGTE